MKQDRCCLSEDKHTNAIEDKANKHLNYYKLKRKKRVKNRDPFSLIPVGFRNNFSNPISTWLMFLVLIYNLTNYHKTKKKSNKSFPTFI